MLTIYNLIGTSFVCGFQLNKKVYTIFVWNTISGSSNLDICCYHCLILTLIFHLKVLINFFLFFFTIIIIVVVVLLLSIIYTINLPVVRPRSYRVIYYFDTPALGRRHQSFGRVTGCHCLLLWWLRRWYLIRVVRLVRWILLSCLIQGSLFSCLVFKYACLGRLFPSTRFLCCNHVLQVRLASVSIGRMFPSVYSRITCSGEAVPQHKPSVYM